MASAVSSSARGVSLLILIQLSSRASTFVVNQLLLRYLSPSLLGVAAQLELYSISVLFFARESLRVALQRQTGDAQSIVNIAYIPVALGIPLSIGLGYLYTATELIETPDVPTAVAVYGLAAFVELLSEPCFAIMQQNLAYGVRASAETSATIARGLVTLGIVVWCHRSHQAAYILAFAFGQLTYATVLLLVYLVRVLPLSKKQNFSLLPMRLDSDPTEYIYSYFSRTLCVLGVNLYLQSTVKYVLTQADSLLIMGLASLEDQGAYALASNYGGLVARIIFQPIEESSRNMFAKLCSNQTGSHAKAASVAGRVDARTLGNPDLAVEDDSVHDANSPKNTKPDTNITQAAAILSTILRLYTLLAVVACSVGPYIAPRLLSVLAGSRWSSTAAGPVLSSYAYYIPLLAINGVTEAFVAAVASNTDLRSQSLAMCFYFVAFGAAAYLFLHVMDLGAQGLVWANCVNMSSRIIWGCRFISAFFAKRGASFPFVDTLPASGSIAAAVLANTALTMKQNPVRMFGSDTINELLWASAITACLVVSVVVFERRFLRRCHRMIVERPAR